jgi:autotransporter-associated beta strand protein
VANQAGVVTDIVITDPGSGYTSAPTISGGFGAGSGASATLSITTGDGGLTKQGAGTLTLSGANTYSGATTVSNGTLRLTAAGNLAQSTDVHLASGSLLELDFEGRQVVHALYTGGVLQPAGEYTASNLPQFIQGTGTLVTRTPQQALMLIVR